MNKGVEQISHWKRLSFLAPAFCNTLHLLVGGLLGTRGGWNYWREMSASQPYDVIGITNPAGSLWTRPRVSLCPCWKTIKTQILFKWSFFECLFIINLSKFLQVVILTVHDHNFYQKWLVIYEPFVFDAFLHGVLRLPVVQRWTCYLKLTVTCFFVDDKTREVRKIMFHPFSF